MMNDVPLIETKNLKKYFSVGKNTSLHAVDDVSLKIRQGTTVGLVGESGCGKSTLGRVILRLHEPTDGDLLYKGTSYLHLKGKELREMRKKMQIIFQDPYASLNPRMTVSELIAEYMIVANSYKTKAEIYKRTGELMDIVGLAKRVANAYPHELDGGRRQRIGIARALSVQPEFIVCDEPVSALDVSIQAQILNLFKDLQKEFGLTYLFVTHNLSVVKHISDEIVVMYLGQCVEKATTEELFRNPCHPYTKALLSSVPTIDIDQRLEDVDIIRGEVSNPINPKPGCRFASRCEYASDRCRQCNPASVDVGNGHIVSCVLFDNK